MLIPLKCERTIQREIWGEKERCIVFLCKYKQGIAKLAMIIIITIKRILAIIKLIIEGTLEVAQMIKAGVE